MTSARSRPSAPFVTFVLLAALSLAAAAPAAAAPRITRLTPPSELYASGRPDPVIARFLPGQRFDLQASVQPEPGRRIASWQFLVDGREVRGGVRGETVDGLVAGRAAHTTVVSVRGHAVDKPGLHTFTVRVAQDDGAVAEATGNFEIVAPSRGGRRVRNVIFLLGDGMGASHRTAARIVFGGYAQGKARTPLAMDSFPVTAMVKTASLNSIVTDSSPGRASYVTGNKHANNQQGVFPDDTTSPFDNPRVEYLAEYLHRTVGTALGIVTTADVFDSTPASMAVHTADRRAGTGIVDQFHDDRTRSGLRVLLGGGRKWFLPNAVPGSARSAATDYVLPPELARAWTAAPGAIDPARDLIADFRASGFEYASNATELAAAQATNGRLLGLFAYSNMNVALDKVAGRRGTSDVVERYGLPDQPMLDEMTAKAVEVLSRERRGFLLLVEAASIDKQAHNMDSDRWVLETLEFDRAIRVAQGYARARADPLVIVPADHECSGATIIGAATLGAA
ncbi:MAG: alkaline phosphatase, partial [Pseudomonadota bacterium]